MEDLTRKRVRDDSDQSNELTVKKLREDLLGFLDDSDPDPATQDLDFIIKSFEEEISASPSSHAAVVDLTSDSGDSQAELGYLLEASDDELGIPPSMTSPSVEVKKTDETELIRVASDSSGIDEFWRFDDEIHGYNSFEFGPGDEQHYSNHSEYVALDGLFENSDACFDSSDFSWRHETMPAL